VPIRAIEIMEKHTYDADKDGRIEKDALKITLDKLLKGAGAGADPTEIAPFDILDKFREFIPWVSLDGFTVGGDAGYSISANVAILYVETAGTANYDAWCRNNANWYLELTAGKLITFEFPIVYMNSVADVNVWIRMSKFADVTDPPTETANHFGWKIVGVDLYASNADGTTQTITDTGVNLAGGSQRTRLKIVLNPGTDCKFYVNDVLKVTHTANLPTEPNLVFHEHIRTLAAAGKALSIGRFILEKEY